MNWRKSGDVPKETGVINYGAHFQEMGCRYVMK